MKNNKLPSYFVFVSAALAFSFTASGATSLSATTGTVNGNPVLFRATFDRDDWSGDLAAYKLGNGLPATEPLWRASTAMPAPRSRNIVTIDSAGFGVGFAWQYLGADARSEIGSKVVLRYIRGRDGHTEKQGGSFRNRASKLGDIVHASPAFVGDQSDGYAILPSNAGDAYRAYVRGKADITNLVLVGANDGMVHAFAADDGRELFAYVPRQLFDALSALTDPDYGHRYYVDGPIAAADAWLNDQWATVAVTTLGRGGKGAFALDITQPESFTASDVLWEMTPVTVADSYDAYLGKRMGRAAIVRLENGKWVALLSNGYNSSNGTAALIVVALATGDILKVLDTGAGPDNGLSTPLAIDRNRNGAVDTVYAGDLQGNAWKFDLSADSAFGWTIAHGGNPLFTATADDGSAQPITARPGALAHQLGGVLVVFGTGQLASGTHGHRTAEQSIYGVWDTEGVVQDADGNPVLDQPASGVKQLVEQTVRATTVVSDKDVRILTSKPVNYGTKDNGYRGWVVDLTRHGERVVRDIRIFDGKVIIVSTIPNTSTSKPDGDSALFQLNPLNGSQFQHAVLDLNGDQTFDSADGAKQMYPGVVDLDVGLASRPFILIAEDGSQTILVSGSGLETSRLGTKRFLQPGRASWVRRR